jgi:hypothetical protein
MTNVFVEPRPKGKPEGTPIRDFVVEDHADHELAAFKTQEDAIFWLARTVIHLTWRGCAISTTRGRTIGDASKAITICVVLSVARGRDRFPSHGRVCKPLKERGLGSRVSRPSPQQHKGVG